VPANKTVVAIADRPSFSIKEQVSEGFSFHFQKPKGNLEYRKMASVEDFHEVDDILNLFGNPGWFQIIQFVVLSLQYVPLAMNDFIPVFYGMPPLAVQCRERGDFNSSFSDPDDLPVNGTDKALMGEYRNASDIYSCHCRHGFTYEYPGHQWSIIADVCFQPKKNPPFFSKNKMADFFPKTKWRIFFEKQNGGFFFLIDESGLRQSSFGELINYHLRVGYVPHWIELF
jgi:hypothetical protein